MNRDVMMMGVGMVLGGVLTSKPGREFVKSVMGNGGMLSIGSNSDSSEQDIDDTATASTSENNGESEKNNGD